MGHLATSSLGSQLTKTVVDDSYQPAACIVPLGQTKGRTQEYPRQDSGAITRDGTERFQESETREDQNKNVFWS